MEKMKLNTIFKMENKKIINVNYTFTNNGVNIDVRDLSLTNRLKMGLSIIFKREVMIKGRVNIYEN